MAPSLLAALSGQTESMCAALEQLVTVETPSRDHELTAAGALEVAALGADLLGAQPETVLCDGPTHLIWRFGGPTKVLLVGHLDTVWPAGTLARWPFTITGDIASGPGCFDMKAGLVQGLYALAALDDLDGVTLLVTSDEEIGSPSSRELIEDTARGALAALILEPSAAGALKTARKGVSMYRLSVAGRAAHAGLEPEKGRNAAVELAHQVLALGSLARPDLGTTVTPTVLAAGTTTNVVPASAYVDVDVRAAMPEEQQRVDEEMRHPHAVVDGTALTVSGGPNRPPLPAASSAALFDRAVRLAAELGIPPLRGVEVGGGSDGNFTAGVGVPTLDGLGPVGDGAHAEGEHVLVSAMPARAALVASLVADLLR